MWLHIGKLVTLGNTPWLHLIAVRNTLKNEFSMNETFPPAPSGQHTMKDLIRSLWLDRHD